MKNEKYKKLVVLSTLVFFALIATAVFSGNAGAKSLYVCADTWVSSTPINAYNINPGGTLTYQATYNTYFGGGSVGLAIDSNSGYLFLTREGYGLLSLINGTTMTGEGTITAPGASNLAGIVVDTEKSKVYAVDRSTNHLYVYSWDAATETLTNDITSSPYYVPLPGVYQSYGIALDEANDLLYVGDYTTTVKVLSTDDWSLVGSGYTVPQIVQGIALDVNANLIYTGNALGSGLLCKYNMNNDSVSTFNIRTLSGAPTDDNVVGLAVDQDTGLVYIDTGNQYGTGSDRIIVFDSDFNIVDQTGDIGNPTGLCIPTQQISYNPLDLEKDDGVSNEDCVNPGDEINYTICYNNTLQSCVNNVLIVDTLPAEVSFVAASDGGVYDDTNKTVTWEIPLVCGGVGDCFWLLVEVNQSTPPGTSIVNYATIDSDETPSTTVTEVTTVCEQQDQTPPVTNKTVGQPKCGENDEWVTLATEFSLTATDEENGSGVKETYYRIWWNDSGVWTDVSGIQIYDGEFTIGDYHNEECEHRVEYWSVDNANNEEVHHNQTHYVDESAPITYPYPPEFGYPQTLTEYWENGDVTTFTMINCSTPMWINVTDVGCGSGAYRLRYSVWVNQTAPKRYEKIQGSDRTIYDGGQGDLDNEVNGKISVMLTFNEGCFHEVRWDVEDYCFGHIAYFDYDFAVDCVPPEITKETGDPWCPAVGEYDSWVNFSTPFYLNATDAGCNGGAGVWKIGYEIRVKNYTIPGKWDIIREELIFDEETGDEWYDIYGKIRNITFMTEECAHEISFWAMDYVGNRVDHKQKHYVDNTPPEIYKTIGDPNCTGCPDCGEGDYCVRTNTPITLDAEDFGCEGGVGGTIIKYRIWNGTAWTRWLYEPLTFTFAEECKHYLEVVAMDCLGNTAYDNETFFVDNTPPEIEKTVGDPNIQFFYWAANVEASWPGHSSSVQQNFPADWGRWTATNTYKDIYGSSADSWAESDFSKQEFDVDMTREFDGENVEWTIQMNSDDIDGHWSTGFQVIITDADEPLFTLGWSPGESTSDPVYKPYISGTGWGSSTTDLPDGMSVSGSYNEEYYEVVIPKRYLGFYPDYWVRCDTPITINAADMGCCGSLTYVAYSINGGDLVQIPIEQLPAVINFGQDCVHTLDIVAKDCLGNTAWDNETFYVDCQPPVIDKTVGKPQYNVGLPPGDYYVTSDTPIWVNATDTGIHPCIVGSVNLTVSVFYNGSYTYYYDEVIQGTASVGPIYLEGECIHRMDITARDNLGNTVFDNETFYVDNTPPNITKIHPDPGFVPIEGMNGGYLNCDSIILEAVDPGTAYSQNQTNVTLNETILQAIDKGLAYLASQQYSSGQVGSSYPVASTGFAVLKWAEHAKRFENKDPFDPTYNYSSNIILGLNYLFNNSYTVAIGPQPAGNPDINLVNGQGIVIYGDYGHQIYETGIVMQALEATCHPDRIVEYGPLAGWTYLDVMKDMVDFVCWAQNEAGSGRGGWRYTPNYGSSDNSVSQWPVLGLITAESWGVHAPNWVKSELLIWLDYSQKMVSEGGTGGFGYDYPTTYVDIDLTASGMIQLTYCGMQTSDEEMTDAINYIAAHWNDPPSGYTGQNIGYLYSMYAVMKASMLAQPGGVTQYGTHDWQAEYDTWLLANQYADGHWEDAGWGDAIQDTEWALLILQRIAPQITSKCASGVESIFWRYQWNDGSYPQEGDMYAVDGATLPEKYGPEYNYDYITSHWWYQINDSTAYVQFDQECVHELYYFTKDNVYNRGPVHHQTYYVDCSPPESWKTVEGPHHPAYPEDIDEFGLKGEDEILYFWIRDNDTLITIDAEDKGTDPCIAGLDYIHIELWWDSDNDNITETKLWEQNVSDTSYSFKIMEDCLHKIVWYAVDILGNTEVTHYQYHRVDSTPPNSTKTFDGPTYPADDYPNPDYGEDYGLHYWVTSDTKITLTGIDEADPCAVGVDKMCVKIEWDSDCDGEVDTTLFGLSPIADPPIFEFTFGDWAHPGAPLQAPYEGLHKISWRSTDLLGNVEEFKVQYHWVDDTPPHIVIIKPVDGWYKDGSQIPSIVFAEDLTNPHGPCSLFDEGAVGIADGKQGGGFLIDVFPDFDIIPLDGTNFIYNESAMEYIGSLKIPDPSGIPDGAVLFVANASDNLGNGANSLLEILHALFMQSGGDPNLFEQLIMQFLLDQNIVFIGIDNTAPMVTITDPEEGDTIGPDTFYVSADMLDVLSGITSGTPCYISLDGINLGTLPYINGVCSGTLAIPDYMQSAEDVPLAVSVFDLAGNQGSDTVLVDLNNEPASPPTCNIISPANDTTHSGYIHLVIEASDPETSSQDLIVGIEVDRQGDPPFVYYASYQSGDQFTYDLDVSKYQDGAKLKVKAFATDEDGSTVYSPPKIYWVDSTIIYDKWLANGWNLLNLPDIGCDRDVEKVMFSVFGYFDWVFEVGTWNNYKLNRPINTLQQMTAGNWYWVHMNNTQKRFYLDVYPPHVTVDDPKEGEVKEGMDNTNIFAYDDESWITDVYVEIYDKNDSLYYNGTGWQTDPIWLDCYHISGDEWGYNTADIWTNDHDYTLTAQAFDASGCSDDDSVDFTIHWEEYNIFGTVFYEGVETGTIYVCLIDEYPTLTSVPVDFVTMGSPGPYSFLARNYTYYIGVFMDMNGNGSFDDGDEPCGFAINKSYYGSETPDEIEVDGADLYGVDVTLIDAPLPVELDVEITYPLNEPIVGDDTLTITGTASSPVACVEEDNVSIAIYYTNNSDGLTYYWNAISGEWEPPTIIYNDISYISGGCGTPLVWEFTPATDFFHEDACTYYIHVTASDNNGNTGEDTSSFTISVPQSDFVAYWKLDGDLLDSIGTNHGIGFGNVAPTTGMVGQGYVFDGDQDYIDIAPVIGGMSDWTWSAWIYPTGAEALYSEGLAVEFEIFITAVGNIRVSMYNIGTDWVALSTSGNEIQFNQWNHIAISLTGGGVGTGTLDIYVNGEQVATGAGQLVASTFDAVIGYNVGRLYGQFTPGPSYAGTMDEIAIFDRALLSEEIRQCYDNGYYCGIGYLG